MSENNRKNIIAAVIALLFLGAIIASIIFFVRLQNENREKNLKITPTFTGPPTQAN